MIEEHVQEELAAAEELLRALSAGSVVWAARQVEVDAPRGGNRTVRAKPAAWFLSREDAALAARGLTNRPDIEDGNVGPAAGLSVDGGCTVWFFTRQAVETGPTWTSSPRARDEELGAIVLLAPSPGPAAPLSRPCVPIHADMDAFHCAQGLGKLLPTELEALRLAADEAPATRAEVLPVFRATWHDGEAFSARFLRAEDAERCAAASGAAKHAVTEVRMLTCDGGRSGWDVTDVPPVVVEQDVHAYLVRRAMAKLTEDEIRALGLGGVP